jgi:hypothetical protein
MAANELRNPALSAGCAPPITGGKAMLAREARDDAKAVHKEKRCEGGGVNRKNALNDRERIIGVAARQGSGNREKHTLIYGECDQKRGRRSKYVL